ncbi:hypothetical protein CTAYLR_005537 [Chrysophaeum taylorii]|uniref:ABC transporter domain-containing protein n=1 Tax=Chrysophaeum taylorii TaxID=2483200 RepID=A0AAD7U5P3_9STRA|nr:hypothetical protein CTAYLR_005537 [Chrysophaeum taylorii]
MRSERREERLQRVIPEDVVGKIIAQRAKSFDFVEASFSCDVKSVPLVISRLGVSVKGHQVLSRVSARCAPGELTCVMGPSGAGKTQLLLTLAGRLPAGATVAGNATLGGVSILGLSPQTRKDLIGYVSQEPAFCPGWESMSVGAYVDYVAMLQLGFRADYSVLDALDVDVRTQISVLSGGERKRLAIAADALLKRSQVCLYDEPTSSLGHADALGLVRFISRLTRRANCFTIATIHQPGDSIFSLFDALVLLKSGSAVYAGPRAEARDRLEGNSPASTTAEWLLDSISMFDDFAVDDLSRDDQERTFRKPAASFSIARNALEFVRETTVLTRRLAAIFLFDVNLTAIPFVLQMAQCTLSGWFMLNPSNTADGAWARFYAASFTQAQSHDHCVPLIVCYCAIAPITSSEMRNGRYRYVSFFVALFICTSIRSILMTIPTMTIYYVMVDWYPGSPFFKTALFQWLGAHSLTLMTILLVSALQGDTTLASLMMTIWMILNNNLKGVFFSQRVMPTALAAHFSDILPLRWVNDGTATSQLRGRVYECRGREKEVYLCPVRGSSILDHFNMGQTRDWVLRFGVYELACVIVILCALHRIVICRIKLVAANDLQLSGKNHVVEPVAVDNKDVDDDDKVVQRLVALLSETTPPIVRPLRVEQLSVGSSRSSLVRNASFRSDPGSLTAIFGNSGSGKSTLLNALAGRIPATGRVERHHAIAYVQQHPQLPRWLNVLELFAYHAQLAGLPEDIVDATIGFLGLRRVARTNISRLSGGEARRAALGADGILSGRPWLLIDEPTTGLSASDAYHLAKNMHAFALATRWVLLTSLHSPRVEIFALFETVVLLGKGGVCYYAGPRDQVPASFEGSDANAAEAIMTRLKVLDDYDDDDDEILLLRDNEGPVPAKVPPSAPYAKPTLEHVWIHCRRHTKLTLRNPGLGFALLLQHSLVSAVIGLACSRLDVRLASLARDVAGVAQIAPTLGFATSMMAWDVVDDLEHQVCHEVRCGKYSAMSSLAALVAVHSFRVLLCSALPAVVPTYFLAGLNPTPRAFLHTLATTWICCLYGLASLLFLLGLCRKKAVMGTWMALVFYTSTLNGFYRAIADFPKVLRWFANHLGVFYMMLDVAVTTQLPKTLRCGRNRGLSNCPVSAKTYLQETHSYARHTLSARYLQASTLVLLLGALGCVFMARRLHY